MPVACCKGGQTIDRLFNIIGSKQFQRFFFFLVNLTMIHQPPKISSYRKLHWHTWCWMQQVCCNLLPMYICYMVNLITNVTASCLWWSEWLPNVIIIRFYVYILMYKHLIFLKTETPQGGTAHHHIFQKECSIYLYERGLFHYNSAFLCVCFGMDFPEKGPFMGWSM